MYVPVEIFAEWYEPDCSLSAITYRKDNFSYLFNLHVCTTYVITLLFTHLHVGLKRYASCGEIKMGLLGLLSFSNIAHNNVAFTVLT